MPKASIIIRSKDEEQWLKHCLKAVYAQRFRDFEVIVVDNESRDSTVQVAQRHGVDKVVTISDYRPGLALNLGIAESNSEFVVCLSAHCIPKDDSWLTCILRGFEDLSIAGIYGRQLPVSYSSDHDKRDLLITFGLDRRVQIKDPFFHNANSALRREIWEKVPFDDAASNIEDRIWGKAVIAAGYRLLYESEAPVYHYHGIHQNLGQDRARSVVSVLEKVEPDDDINGLPDSMKPTASHIVAVCPVLGTMSQQGSKTSLVNLIENLKASKFVDSVHVLSENPQVGQIARDKEAQFILRPDFLYPPDASVEDALQYAFSQIEGQGQFPDAVLYVNYLFPHRPVGFFDELIHELHFKGLDTVFGGFPDYQNYWVNTLNEGFRMIGDGMKPRAVKRPMYRALYGLGTITTAPQIRKGTLIGERVGIIPITDHDYAAKVNSSMDSEWPF